MQLAQRQNVERDHVEEEEKIQRKGKWKHKFSDYSWKKSEGKEATS